MSPTIQIDDTLFEFTQTPEGKYIFAAKSRSGKAREFSEPMNQYITHLETVVMPGKYFPDPVRYIFDRTVGWVSEWADVKIVEGVPDIDYSGIEDENVVY